MGTTLMLHLKNGENHFVDPKDAERYFRILFANQDFAIQNIDDRFERTDRKNRGQRELPIKDLKESIKETEGDIKKLIVEFEPIVWQRANNLIELMKKDSVLTEELKDREFLKNIKNHYIFSGLVKREEGDVLKQIERLNSREETLLKRIAIYKVEIHKKISTAVACIIFALIGAPLGIIAKRGGIGPGTVYSLGFFTIYWVCLIGGENLADRLLVPPAISMWACNALIGTIGLFLTWRVAKL